jgi:hypothetical protein
MLKEEKAPDGTEDEPSDYRAAQLHDALENARAEAIEEARARLRRQHPTEHHSTVVRKIENPPLAK